MKKNVCSYDVGVRFVLGCIILFVGVNLESWWGLVGLAPLATAFAGFCPLYVPFGWDTTRFD
ncbi:MAG: DUF2892 domain-containing protein [Candidatus Didemnitutus sp.]|nr:DUF2892 domain-containing protein [Candidatus Didemnitutus sp.]